MSGGFEVAPHISDTVFQVFREILSEVKFTDPFGILCLIGVHEFLQNMLHNFRVSGLTQYSLRACWTCTWILCFLPGTF